MELQGTVAIVTGGNGGLGQRICHALAKAGSHIVVVYTHSREAAQAVASGLQQTGVRAEAMACDVANPPQVEQFVSRVLETFGGGENGDVRHFAAAGARGVARDRGARVHVEEIADHTRAVRTGETDERGALGNPRIGVVDHDQAPGAKRFLDHFALALLALGRVWPEIFAHVHVGAREFFSIQRAFSHAGQAD